MNRLKVTNCGETAVSSLSRVHWCNLETAALFDGRHVPFETVLKECDGHPYPILVIPANGDSAALLDQFESKIIDLRQEIGQYGILGGRPTSH